MAGWWLISYIALWLVVLAVCLLEVGNLRELGLLRRSTLTPLADPPDTGPPIGAPLPSLTLSAAQGTSSVHLGTDSADRTLLAFLTPGCNGCHSAAELLERCLGTKTRDDLEVIIVLCAPFHSCQTFLSVYKFAFFVTIDEDSKVAETFRVRTYPVGLLYGRDGTLMRKGVIPHEPGLQRVLHGEQVTATLQKEPA